MNKLSNCISIILSLLFCVACVEMEEEPNSVVEHAKSADLHVPDVCLQIGQAHNDGLESVFSEIRNFYEIQNPITRSSYVRRKDLRIIDRLEYKELVQKTAKDFVKGLDLEAPEETRSEVNILDFKMNQDSINHYSSRIRNILKAKPKNQEELVCQLNKVCQDVELYLNPAESICIYGSIAVCYYSYSYWSQNHMKWLIAHEFPELLFRFEDNELNACQVRGGKLYYTKPALTRGFLETLQSLGETLGDTWGTVKDFIGALTDAGADIINADAEGFAQGFSQAQAQFQYNIENNIPMTDNMISNPFDTSQGMSTTPNVISFGVNQAIISSGNAIDNI